VVLNFNTQYPRPKDLHAWYQTQNGQQNKTKQKRSKKKNKSNLKEKIKLIAIVF